ncbi:Uncharacterised protein [Mycobacteroides abscessus]|nr:Uncharacterised protein [Mycobacteroides abscessus]SIN56225.1 Uncharacterised protein [Mycobacteroides abscessus subsp. abscessus]
MVRRGASRGISASSPTVGNGAACAPPSLKVMVEPAVYPPDRSVGVAPSVIPVFLSERVRLIRRER